MKAGREFEVSKEVFERAKAKCSDKNRLSFYMAREDKEQLFDECIRFGYGLYNCQVYERDGRYFCSYMTGDSCD